MSENKPIKKYSAGAISASVWKNEMKDGSVVHAVSIERRYQDKEGDWQSTNNMRMNDLPKVRLLADKAYEFLAMASKEEREGSSPSFSK
jgi:hypothetical protein